jgi:hypothetical protein
MGGGVPFWGTDPILYDQILIGPSRFLYTPVEVNGEVGFKLDVKPAPGTDGAYETNQGYEPAKLEVSLSLYLEEHLRAWEELLKVIRPLPGKQKSEPVNIVHPLLDLYGLRRFRVPKIPLLKRDGPQSYGARLQCVEHFDQPKAMGKQSPKIANLDRIFQGSNRANPTPPSKTNTGP